MTGSESAEALASVRALADRAASVLLSASPVLLTAAMELHAAHRAASAIPEAFARGAAPGADDLVERSIRAELAVALGVSERDVVRRLMHARLLAEDLPLTRAALAEARMLWEAGEVICAAAATLPAESLDEFDARAVEAAALTTPTQLRRAAARLREELHPEPLAQRHARAREERSVWVRPEIDGMATLCALLPAATAMGAYARMDRTARRLREDAAGDTGAGDGRTLAQLRADALADLLCDGEITGSDDAKTFVPGVRPEVRLTLGASTAAGLDDASAHLDGYGAVPADVARELVGIGASFTRILTDPDSGAVMSVGRTHRVPPAQMRLHLQLRDQTCRFPGCTRPAATAEADHILEWRNGGETSLENLASLCVAHHHVRHGDRWTYRLLADGAVAWTTPTGRSVTSRAPALPGRPPERPPRPADERPPVGPGISLQSPEA